MPNVAINPKLKAFITPVRVSPFGLIGGPKIKIETPDGLMQMTLDKRVLPAGFFEADDGGIVSITFMKIGMEEMPEGMN